MRRKLPFLAVLLLVTALFGLATTSAARPAAPASGNATSKAEIYGELPASGNVKVIVRLEGASLASYRGGMRGLAATSPSVTGGDLDASSPASVAYLEYLAAEHARFVADVQGISPSARQIASYAAVLNGVALDLPAADVEQLLALPQVRSIEVNRIEQLLTDSSAEFIGATQLWEDLGGQATAGENVVLGIIDSGIYNPSAAVNGDGIHPSLTDPSPVGGDYANTFDYVGVCAAAGGQTQDGTFGDCNDKLIGAWWYNGAGIANPLEPQSPLDGDSHGTHTATTAGGNGGVVAPLGTISGIAPRARIIAYKVCWEEDPSVGDDGGCGTVDSVAAINQTVLDGVDVINYSISGGSSPWIDTVEQAFLDAVEAGIAVNASAGNAGTDGSVAHLSPWDHTVAASTQAREFVGTISVTGPGTPPGPFEGSSGSPGTVTGEVILAPLQGTETTLPSLCQEPYAPGTFEATDIVICRRGVNARVEKYANVNAGGAGAGIIVNANNNQGVVVDFCPADFVCLHLEKNATAESPAGEDLITYVAANPGAVTGTIEGGIPENGPGDVMAGFSSRGPASIPDILKPDITSVGVDVYAGGSNTSFDVDDPDTLFRFISGTSMSSPHVAGAAALLTYQHPDWTPMEIKSALMTTAKTEGVVKPDGVTPADPFNMGSGRTDLTVAGDAGLLLDETPVNFAAANPAAGGDPRTLNLANFVNSACVGTCTWTRTLTSPLTTDVTWTSSFTSDDGVTVTVEPSSFTIPAGGSQTIQVTADVGPSLDEWLFAEVMLMPDDSSVPMAHFPVVVEGGLSNVPDSIERVITPEQQSFLIPGLQSGTEITALTIADYGLVVATIADEVLEADSNNGSPYDDLTDGVFYVEVEALEGTMRIVAEITATSAQDIDLYLTRDLNDNGIPEAGEEVDSSTQGSGVLDYINYDDVGVDTYHIVVQNWLASTPGASDAVTLAYGVVPNSNLGNWDVTGPTSVPAREPFALTANVNQPGLVDGDRLFGTILLGSDATETDDLGRIDVDVVVEDDATSVTLADFDGGSGGFPWLPVLATTLVLAGGLVVALRRRAAA